MMVELNADEIRQIVHGEPTNPEIPERVLQEVRRYMQWHDGIYPSDEELPVWYRDHGLESSKPSEASTDWVNRHCRALLRRVYLLKRAGRR
jgi:hypothetical protein